MNESEFPCPNCSGSLVLDPATAGRRVVCPYCDTRVMMPPLPSSGDGADISSAGRGSIPAPRPAGELPRTHAVDEQRAFGNPTPAPAEAPASDRQAALPPMRNPAGRAARPSGTAAAATAPAALDLSKMERGGLHGFACPVCGRPLWYKKKDAGESIECESCRSEIAAPDPDAGKPARLIKGPEVEARPRTVLPDHRQSAASAPTGGPPRVIPRQAPTGPAAAAAAPPASTASAATAASAPAPAAPAANPEVGADPASAGETASAPRPAIFRLGESRKLRMTPKGEIDADVETAGQWGEDLDVAEMRRRKNRRLIVAAVVLALPLLGVLLWNALQHHFNPPPPSPDAGISDGGQAAEDLRRAIGVIKSFLAAENVEARSAFVRHPEVTRARMETWHAERQPFKAYGSRAFHSRTEEQTIDGVTFILVLVDLDDHSTRAIAVENMNGNCLVDWESFVGWSEVSWTDFLSREPAEPHDFRVVIAHDTYYNFHYTDDTQYFCYKLVDMENSAHCYAYTSLNSEVGQKINRMIRRQRHAGEESIKAIVKMHFEPAARGHLQAWLDEVIQDGWVKVDP